MRGGCLSWQYQGPVEPVKSPGLSNSGRSGTDQDRFCDGQIFCRRICGRVPFGHHAIEWQSRTAEEMSRLLSPMKTGDPEVIFIKLAAAGQEKKRIATRAGKIYFPCMKSNFKTLMIKIMLIQNSGNFTRNTEGRVLKDPKTNRERKNRSGDRGNTEGKSGWMRPTPSGLKNTGLRHLPILSGRMRSWSGCHPMSGAATCRTSSLPGSAGVGKTTAAVTLAREFFKDSWQMNFRELNASDERGIDVVRNQIKQFARTTPLGDARFKILFLDEADALTTDAQSALRRTMESYAQTCRFILSCNYSSKIIDPIQSRCAIYRFKPLGPGGGKGRDPADCLQRRACDHAGGNGCDRLYRPGRYAKGDQCAAGRSDHQRIRSMRRWSMRSPRPRARTRSRNFCSLA